MQKHKLLLHKSGRCSFKKIYRILPIMFNISMVTVGCINQNGIVTFGKICHMPRAGTALICTEIKRARREGLNILISKLSCQRNWYSRGLTEKKLQTIKFACQYRISHCKNPSIELILITWLIITFSKCVIIFILPSCTDEAFSM